MRRGGLIGTASAAAEPPPKRIVTALGLTQIMAWGSSFYLPAVLAKPVADATGWPLAWIVGGLSLALLIAGLASPLVGRQIHRRGGRPVLATGAGLLALGLATLAVAPALPVFLFGWLIIGFGMSAGLYDAAFSTLGRIYGQSARRHITTLTLFGGFASTACWPLSAYLVSMLGWRGACGIYAAIQLFVSLPIYLAVLPRHSAAIDTEDIAADKTGQPLDSRPPKTTFVLLAVTIMTASVISTVISVHLMTILQARDITLAAAVALGAVVGPSQVGARFIEMLIARFHHPIWTKLAAVGFVAVGLGLLWIHFPVTALALVFYGAGIGLESIARATLPLALYGARDYAPIMGRLARPSLIAQAAAPSVSAMAIQFLGSDRTLGIVAIVCVVNVVMVLGLFALIAKNAKRDGKSSGDA